jgi:hypothetical protein
MMSIEIEHRINPLPDYDQVILDDAVSLEQWAARQLCLVGRVSTALLGAVPARTTDNES